MDINIDILHTSELNNYDNALAIKQAQKKYDKLAKKGKDPLAVAMAKKQLEDTLLFSDCFCPGYHKGFTDNVEGVLFSNQHRLIKLFDSVFPYEKVARYSINGVFQDKAYTTTKNKGGVGRAIIGGALFGGVGAVVGAVTSGSRSQTVQYQTQTGFTLHIFDGGGNCLGGVQMPGEGLFNDKIPKSFNRIAFVLDAIIKENQDKADIQFDGE
ncbi:MAG: hypothetical protein LBL82_07995 [Oscillospiraceae bacterium]|jgi:hypothetical protein|nr:hypothetical protein [Oscillospiraceae bacterium]